MTLEEAQKLKEQIQIGGGKTLAEAERNAGKSIIKAVQDAWNKGVSVNYQDERCSNDPNGFISANPDGSEDLIYIDFLSREKTIIRNLAPEGKGKYAHLIIHK
jgi:hypothetical protein